MGFISGPLALLLSGTSLPRRPAAQWASGVGRLEQDGEHARKLWVLQL